MSAALVRDAHERWVKAGRLRCPPDGLEAGDAELAFWAEVESLIGEIQEGTFVEAQHPRNRLGKFIDKPQPRMSDEQAWRNAFEDISFMVELHGVVREVSVEVYAVHANGSVDVYGNLVTDGGEEVGSFGRSFDRTTRGLVASHDDFDVSMPYQGLGIAERFLAASEEMYRRIGVTEIRLPSAVNVGSYAWARAGFRFDDRSYEEITGDEMTGFVAASMASTWPPREQLAHLNVPEDELEEFASRFPTFEDVRAGNLEGRFTSPLEIAMFGRDRTRWRGRLKSTSTLHGSGRETEMWLGKAYLLSDPTWSGYKPLHRIVEALGDEAHDRAARAWEAWVAEEMEDPLDDEGFWRRFEAESIREGVWREYLHPRNRHGKFIRKIGLPGGRLVPGPIEVAELPPQTPEEFRVQEDAMEAADRMRASLQILDPKDPPALEGFGPGHASGLEEAGMRLTDRDADHWTWMHYPTGTEMTLEVRHGVVDRVVGWYPGERPEPKRIESGHATTFVDLQRDALALGAELAETHKAELGMRSFGVDPDLDDTSGLREWTGDLWIGPDAPELIALRDLMGPSFQHWGPVWFMHQVVAHEVAHAVNPTTFEDYVGTRAGRALEEALTEETSHLIAARRLRARGELEPLVWYRDNRQAPHASGTYHGERTALKYILDEIGVAPEDREELLMGLKFRVPPEERVDALGDMLVASGKSFDEAIEVLDVLTLPPNELDELKRGGPYNIVADLDGLPEGRPERIGLGTEIYEIGQELVLEHDGGPLPGRISGGTDGETLLLSTPLGLARVHDPADILQVYEPGTVEVDNGEARVGDIIEYVRKDGKRVRAVIRRVHRRSREDFVVEAKTQAGQAVVLSPGAVAGVMKVAEEVAEAVWRPELHPRGRLGRFIEVGPTSYSVGLEREGLPPGYVIERRAVPRMIGPGGRMAYPVDTPEDIARGIEKIENEIEVEADAGVSEEEVRRVAERFDGFEHAGMRTIVYHAEGKRSQGKTSFMVDIAIVDENDELVGSAVRWVTGERVDHSYAHVEESHRGRGFMSALNDAMEEQYRELGVREIHLIAEEVGAYAWARDGYEVTGDAEDRRWKLHQLASSRQVARLRERGYSDEEIAEFFGWLEAEPTTIREVATYGIERGSGSWLGKDFLIGSRWAGVKRLD